MSIALSPVRSLHSRRTRAPGFAAICRARAIVTALGGRYSLELGIDLDRDPEEVERWALATSLLDARIPTTVAMCTYRVFEHAGVRTIEDAGRRDREELVSFLEAGGNVPYAERTASRLLAVAEVIGERYGRLATLGKEVVYPPEPERALEDLPGWGAVTVGSFVRELRGVWPGADVPLDTRAAAAAGHLKLAAGSHSLSPLAAAAHLDFRDLEAGLVRLFLCHDLDDCPGGEECTFAALDRQQLVHF